MPDDRARDDLNGAVNLRSDATTPSKANRQRNRCVQQHRRWANHQPRPGSQHGGGSSADHQRCDGGGVAPAPEQRRIAADVVAPLGGDGIDDANELLAEQQGNDVRAQ